MKFRGRGPSATDESVCPTLARKWGRRFRRRFRLPTDSFTAGGPASSLSEDLAQRFTGGGKIRQPHFDILARQHYAVGSRVECGVQGAADVVGLGALVGGTGGDVDIDAGVDFGLSGDARERTLGFPGNVIGGKPGGVQILVGAFLVV